MPAGPAVVAERVVARRLESGGIPKAKYHARTGWDGGVLAEQIGAEVLVHWFGEGAKRQGVLTRCVRVLEVLGYEVEWTTNAAGAAALIVREGS
jgi:hypothetical protein